MTQEQLAAAFTEWMRRYNADPEAFSAEWDAFHEHFVHVAGSEEPAAYGPVAAAYLLKILSEQS